MRARFTLLLALLLLLAQTSARVHAVEHFSGSGHEDPAPVCELCLAQAQSVWGTPAAPQPDAAYAARFEHPAHPILLGAGAHHALAYHSRAPPA